VGDSIKVNLK